METITINEQKVNAVNWIKALLSGEYKQGKEKLGNNTNGFCCWGLGCFIVGKSYDPYRGWDDDFFDFVGFENSSGNIYPSCYGKYDLPSINDNTNAGFKRIGKYLIKHAETNFNKKVAEYIKETFKDI